MKIQLLSDLHIEANRNFVPRPAPGADLLVLAGDIGSYQRRRDGSTMPEPDWALRRFADWPVPVLFVPGNHEYDALDVDEAHASLRASCERLGLRWLEREVWVWHGVRFVGTTLWSDYDAIQPPGSDPLLQREKAYRAANHYLRTMASVRGGALFDAAAMRALGLSCQTWLRDALAQPFDGPTVVITHFAPTLHSADPRYGLTPGTAGFCNALDDLLGQADLWLHGHLHCPTDVRVGRCRIKANPLGYREKQEQAAFDPLCVVEVPMT
jgi:predicted phosphodiesterase